MENYTVALFGEAQKGAFRTAYFCSLILRPAVPVDYFGHPPPESKGLFFAVQALLFHRNILFFRVKEEGFSRDDYLLGVSLLQKQHIIPDIVAIGIPGVGDAGIINALAPVCAYYHSILLTTEADLMDYLNYSSAA